jgi:hypothetical protein
VKLWGSRIRKEGLASAPQFGSLLRFFLSRAPPAPRHGTDSVRQLHVHPPSDRSFSGERRLKPLLRRPCGGGNARAVCGFSVHCHCRPVLTSRHGYGCGVAGACRGLEKKSYCSCGEMGGFSEIPSERSATRAVNWLRNRRNARLWTRTNSGRELEAQLAAQRHANRSIRAFRRCVTGCVVSACCPPRVCLAKKRRCGIT